MPLPNVSVNFCLCPSWMPCKHSPKLVQCPKASRTQLHLTVHLWLQHTSPCTSLYNRDRWFSTVCGASPKTQKKQSPCFLGPAPFHPIHCFWQLLPVIPLFPSASRVHPWETQWHASLALYCQQWSPQWGLGTHPSCSLHSQCHHYHYRRPPATEVLILSNQLLNSASPALLFSSQVSM